MSKNEVNSLIHSTPTGSLGTMAADGFPFVSLVTVAEVERAKMAMLLSGLAFHTKNLAGDSRASLLLIALGGEAGDPQATDPLASDPLARARVTLVGEMRKLSRGEDESTRAAFLAKHPSASMYADFGDFAFYELTIHAAHLIAGFGRIQTFSGEDL